MHSLLLPQKKNLKIRMKQSSRNAHSPLSLSLSPAGEHTPGLFSFSQAPAKRQSYTYNTRTALPPSPPPTTTTTTTTTSATTTTGFHKLSLHLSNYRVNTAVCVKIQASPSIVFSSLLSSPLLYSSLPQEGRKEGRNPAS